MFLNHLFGKAKIKTKAPRYNANGTRAITMEDYRNGNFTSVGAIIQQQMISQALMQSSNQLFSGFQGFAGGAPPKPAYQGFGGFPGLTPQFQQYGTLSNQLQLAGAFQHYSYSLMQMQSQTAMQMQQLMYS